jgi:RNA polymerase sigma-70 factor (ECF subfamily)
MKREEFEKQLADNHIQSFQWTLAQTNYQREIAEEVLQDAYIKAFNNLNSFKGNSSFKTWLYAIIKNTAIDYFRKNNRRAELNVVALEDAKSSKTATQEKRLRAKGDQAAAEHILQSLSKREKEVVELIMYQDLSVTEAAEIMRVSRGSVNTYLKRAKEALKNKIQSERNSPSGPSFEKTYTYNIKKVA